MKTEKENQRLDNIYKKSMLALGALTALLFLLSVIVLIEFPNLFMPIAGAMIGASFVFLILRVIYNYRQKSKVGEK